MITIVDIEELGRRIRKLRLERRMTLKQVEVTSGLSATHLSEIERGRTSPTIGALVRVARALNKDASYFIELEERPDVAHLTREQVRPLRSRPGVVIESLTPGIPSSRLFAYRLLFSAPTAEIALDALDIPGDALYVVRKGTLEAEFGSTRMTLAPGDAAQATFVQPHRIRPGDGESVEVIAVISRPIDDAPVPPGTNHQTGTHP